jgi:hypothetical protein
VDRSVSRDRIEVLSDHDDDVPRLHPERGFDDLEAGHDLQRSDEVEGVSPG